MEKESATIGRGAGLAARLWYLARWAGRKVAARDPLYLPRRVGYSVNRLLVDATFRYRCRWLGRLADTLPGDPVALLEHFRTRRTPRFHFDAQTIA